MKHSDASDFDLKTLGARTRLDQLDAEIRAAKAEQSRLLTRFPALAGSSSEPDDTDSEADAALGSTEGAPTRGGWSRVSWSDAQRARFLLTNIEKGKNISDNKRKWLDAYLKEHGTPEPSPRAQENAARAGQLELPTAPPAGAAPPPAPASPAKKKPPRKAQKRGQRH